MADNNIKNDIDNALGDAKEKATEFAGEAKEAVSDFADSAKEVLGDENKKVLVGVLALLFGSLGVHKFVLGYTKEGVILLVLSFILSIVSCGLLGVLTGFIGVIEGIIYLTKSDEEFYNTYQVGKKAWF